MKKTAVFLILVMLLAGSVPTASAGTSAQAYLISSPAPLTAAQVAQLRLAGANVKYVYQHFGGAAVTISPKKVAKIRLLPFVTSVYEDTHAQLTVSEFASASYSTLPGTPWWLDLIDAEQNTTYDGSGVWVAVLDSGFFPNWRDYINESSILTQYATAFIGAGGNQNEKKWDNGSTPHGMTMSALISGYWLVDGLNEGGWGEGYLTGWPGTYWVPGIAPGAKIIPVKVCEPMDCKLSAVNAGIDYIIGIKLANPDQPIVISEGYGHSIFTPLDKAALDAAISAGVVVVADAGNGGDSGMWFPGAYEPVISVGAGGWDNQFHNFPDKTWWLEDVPENGVDEVHMHAISSRQLPGQYLDVVSTGRGLLLPFPCPPFTHMAAGNCSSYAIPGGAKSKPYQYNFVGGTTFSSATIAGIVALMLQKNPALNNSDATFGTIGDPSSWGRGFLERLLESAATPIPPGSVQIRRPNGSFITQCWELPECPLEATGHGWVFIDDALAAVP